MSKGKGVSKATHTQSQRDHYANQHNSNNPAYHAGQKLANYNQNNITQAIRNDYFQYIKDELRRIVGHTDNSIIEDIINDAAVNLSTVWDDCDIPLLVFDCIRKKAISVCKTDAVVRTQSNVDILRESEFPRNHSPINDLRLDIVLLFLPKKQRKYFLKRYYYLRNDTKVNNPPPMTALLS